MDVGQVLANEIARALMEGDWPRLLTNLAIFVFIWIEVRGLKKEFKKLNSSIANSFAAGETRFSTIETRLTALEKPNIPIGGVSHGSSV